MGTTAIAIVGGLFGLVGLLAVGACADDGTTDVPPGVVDVRVAVPAADDRFVDLVSPEVTIEPGVEKMYCMYLQNDRGELAVREMDALQGQYGHHIVLLTTIVPQPAGTVEDCTAQEEMWKFRSFVLPGNGLPAGHGIRIPAAMQYVMQIHYVNTGEAPILVRDVARLEKIAPASVQTWVTTLTTNRLNFKLRPGPHTETFDCAVTEDVELLLLGGHMHENGARFNLDIGPSVDALRSLYLVDPWKPTYRDAPPVTLFFSQPFHLPAGSVVRTTCEWNNRTANDIEFPDEMCAGFGYLAGTTHPLHCQAE